MLREARTTRGTASLLQLKFNCSPNTAAKKWHYKCFCCMASAFSEWMLCLILCGGDKPQFAKACKLQTSLEHFPKKHSGPTFSGCMNIKTARRLLVTIHSDGLCLSLIINYDSLIGNPRCTGRIHVTAREYNLIWKFELHDAGRLKCQNLFPGAPI